jgi:hypothetical protein
LIAVAIWGVVNSVSVVVSVLLNGASILKQQALLAFFLSTSNFGLSILLTRRMGVLGVCLGSITTQIFIAFPVLGILVSRLFARMKMAEFKQRFPEGEVVLVAENQL